MSAMIDRLPAVCTSGPEAISEVEAEILATVYAFVLNSCGLEGAACVPEGFEDGEA